METVMLFASSLAVALCRGCLLSRVTIAAQLLVGI